MSILLLLNYLEAFQNPLTYRNCIDHHHSNIPPLPLAVGPHACCHQWAFCHSGPQMCAAGESLSFAQAFPTHTCL